MSASCRLAVRAIPNARRGEIAGWAGDVLRVKVRAPALDGRANEALCEFVADALGLPRNAVLVAQGARSRQKLLEIRGLALDEVRARLTPAG